MLLGLRTVVFKVTDLTQAKAWYRDVFGITPYYDQPYYVGYNVGGYELGLDPSTKDQKPGPGGSVAYWGVKDLASAMARLTEHKVEVVMPLQDVGEGIRVATIRDPFGNLIGLIENPHFKLPDTIPNE
ncbi:MAG TPA: VOC family protein [Gemmatimonadaceae bacterium]